MYLLYSDSAFKYHVTQHTTLTNLSGSGYRVYLSEYYTTQGVVNNRQIGSTVALFLGLPCFYYPVHNN